jgi:3-oxoacyl-[acyl-carrier-protein] synthase II
MAKTDHAGRPIVVVTGMGIVTSLGAGREDNWRKLTAGESGIREITRISTEGLKTRIAGTIDFIPVEQHSSPELSEWLAEMAAEEAIAQSNIGSRGDFPGPLFIAVAPVEIEWEQREELVRASGATGDLSYADLMRAGETGEFGHIYERFLFGSVAANIAERFGTKGSPISLSTACASGASAIQLGVEAIRRGEPTPRCASAPTPRSIRVADPVLAPVGAFDQQRSAASGFASVLKDRDGFVMAEGAGALVLESLEAAQARGAKILGVLEGCGEMADSFHRTRSSPDGKPSIGCMRNALNDAGLTSRRYRLHQRARHQHARKRQERVSERLGGVRGTRQGHSDLREQIDDRAHHLGGRRGRIRVQPADARTPAHSADHQL